MRTVMGESRTLGKPVPAAYAGWMSGDDPERWLCHFVGGAWRAPFGRRMARVPTSAGMCLGQVVLADRADLDRANRLRRDAKYEDDAWYRDLVAALCRHYKPCVAPPGSLQGGAIYLAHPQDAVFAIGLAEQTARAGLVPGAFALLYQM